MTVVNPKSISGINSITMASGGDDLLTIHSNNTTERVRVNNSGDVIVGSGVTLSPDGDIFFTGIATGNGSGLTNLATDLVNDTSPQLGGDLQSNSHDIKIADASGYDGNNIYMGSDNDMRIHHDGSNFEMSNSTGTIYLRTDSAVHIQKRDGSTKIAEFNADADVELYHNGTKVCDTSATGILMASGKGIDFANASGSAAGSSASVLDDYEEGTWTPTAHGYSGSNVSGNCFYTKIGRLVIASFRITWPSLTSSSLAEIRGLPFTVRSQTVSTHGGAFSETDDNDNLSLMCQEGSTYMNILRCTSSGVDVQTISEVAGKDFRGNAIYFTDS